MATVALVATSMIVLLRKPPARETLLSPIGVRIEGGEEGALEGKRTADTW
jgi:hypothetical protein